MSETKHTPGPWAYQAKPGPRELTFKRRHWVIGSTVTGHGVGIAFGDGPGEPDDANARLIAAAPDMLEALKHADEWLDELGCDCATDEPGTCAFCLVRAAIAKAEGRP